MAKIEAELGVLSTWYFRWRTARPAVVDAIRAQGHAVGLHYETLTRELLRRGLARPRAEALIPEAGSCYADELAAFAERFGTVRSACPHGDTRMPGVHNGLLLLGEDWSEYGLRWDANAAMRDHAVDVWLTDRSVAEGRWKEGLDPIDLLIDRRSPILAVVHPNNWVSGPGLWWDRVAPGALHTGSDEPALHARGARLPTRSPSPPRRVGQYRVDLHQHGHQIRTLGEVAHDAAEELVKDRSPVGTHLDPLKARVERRQDLLAAHRLVGVRREPRRRVGALDTALAPPIAGRQVGQQLLRQACQQAIDRLELRVAPLKARGPHEVLDEQQPPWNQQRGEPVEHGLEILAAVQEAAAHNRPQRLGRLPLLQRAELKAHAFAQRLRHASRGEVHTAPILVEPREALARSGLHERQLELGVARAQREHMGRLDRGTVTAGVVGLRSQLGVARDTPVDDRARNRALPEGELIGVDSQLRRLRAQCGGRPPRKLRLQGLLGVGGRQSPNARGVFAQALHEWTRVHYAALSAVNRSS